MNENIMITGKADENIQQENIIQLRRIREITSIQSIEKQFKKELKKINTDDIIEHNTSLAQMVSMLADLRPNTIVLKKETTYLMVETDILLKQHIAMRAGKLIATGTIKQCQAAMIRQIQKDYRGKFDELTPEELDAEWLKNFSTVHCQLPRMYRIINIS